MKKQGNIQSDKGLNLNLLIKNMRSGVFFKKSPDADKRLSVRRLYKGDLE